MSAEKVSEVVDTSADVETLVPKTDYKYYDWHPTKEDLMGESVPQDRLIEYLRDLLFGKGNFIVSNINIYQKSGDVREYPIAPDLALFKGVEVPEAEQNRMRSWKLYEPNRPAPSVVFEICSHETWYDDLHDKPSGYLRLGAKEYFAYDPEDPRFGAKIVSALIYGCAVGNTKTTQ